MRDKLVPIYLPKTEYDTLRAVAEAECRDPLQQARWILRQALNPERSTPLSLTSNYYQDGRVGRSRETGHAIQSFSAGSPSLGTAADILAATASAAGSTVTAGITQPATARNIVATPGGTTANVLAVSVIVNGTDVFGQALTETLPAFTAGAATAVVGVKAFKTITSIVLPVVGAATTVSIGRGAKLGLPVPLARNTVLAAYLGGVKEVTPPTVVTHPTIAAQTTVTLNSALNATPVVIDYYEG